MIAFVQTYLIFTIVSLVLARVALPGQPPAARFAFAIVVGFTLLLLADLAVYLLRSRKG